MVNNLCMNLKSVRPNKLSKNKQKSTFAIVSINAFMVSFSFVFDKGLTSQLSECQEKKVNESHEKMYNMARERRHFETMAFTVRY